MLIKFLPIRIGLFQKELDLHGGETVVKTKLLLGSEGERINKYTQSLNFL